MSKNNQKLFVGLCAAAVVGLFSAGVRAEDKIAPGTMDFLSATTISGYVDVTYAYDFAGSTATQGSTYMSTGLGPRFNDFSVTQFKLTLEKPLDKSDWAAGYRVDIVAGQDAGWINSGLGAANFTLEQAYVSARVPIGTGIDMKAGLFTSPFGNEVFETPSNFNIGRSLLFLFGQPRTLTGLEASYNWDLSGGVTLDALVGLANGWTAGAGTAGVADNNTSKSFFGQLRATFWDGKASVATGCIFGPEQTGVNDSYRTLWDTVVTVKPIDKLTLSANADYAQEAFAGAPHGTWWGLSGIADYKWNDWLDTAVRAEFFSDNEKYAAGNTRTGFLGGQDIWSLTGTVGFNIWKNLLTRVELRYSSSSEETFSSGLGDPDGATFGDLSLALEAAYSF